jgi:hypothetical protein
MVSTLTAHVFVAVWLAITASSPEHARGVGTGTTGPGIAVFAVDPSRRCSSPLDETDLVQATSDWPAESAEVVEEECERNEERDGFACSSPFIFVSWALDPPPAPVSTVAFRPDGVRPAPLYLLLVRLTC